MNDDVFGRAFQRYSSGKRRAELSAKEILSGLFLVSAFAFWSVAFWQLLTPPGVVSLLTLQAAVLALAFGVAAPLLWSALLPTTAAGHLLQKSQYATPGSVVTLTAAIFLTYAEFQLLSAWLAAQPRVAESGLVIVLDLALLIAFVLIPALAWTQIPFDKVLQQIRQNHEIKKLEILHRGEREALKASMMRAKVLAIRGWANLLPAERDEAVQTLRGLFMAIADSQRNLMDVAGLSANYDKQLGILQDDEIDRAMRDVQAELAAPVELIEQSIRPDLRRDGDRGMAPVPESPAAPRSAPQRPAAEPYGTDLERARMALRATSWSCARLGEVLEVKERTARDRLNAWIDAGIVDLSDTKGRFYFTERGGRA